MLARARARLSGEGMRVLVLGGTVFLSRAMAAEAVRRGHEVVCACRGESGALTDGVRHVSWDRHDPVPDELAGARSDAVVDVVVTGWARQDEAAVLAGWHAR